MVKVVCAGDVGIRNVHLEIRRKILSSKYGFVPFESGEKNSQEYRDNDDDSRFIFRGNKIGCLNTGLPFHQFLKCPRDVFHLPVV